MTDKTKPAVAGKGGIERAERNTLLTRIGIGGALIIALIAVLAIIEQTQRAPELEALQSTSPPAVAPGEVPQLPSSQASGGAIAPSEVSPKADVPAEPEHSAAPELARPPAPEKEVPPTPEDTHPRLVLGKGAEASAQKTPPASAAAVPALKLAQPEPKPPLEAVKPVRAEPAPARPSSNGYLVQVGVFTNVSNAEELHRKLVDAGIPAHIEARVQLGPFATQAEAADAQKKLKALGLEPGMLIAPRKP